MADSRIHTNPLKDKSFLMTLATLVSILVMDLSGFHISPEVLMTVGGLIATFVVSSKTKQTVVAKAEAQEAGRSASEGAKSLADAARILNGGK